MNSYMSFNQVWITIPQEIWSDHQKGKMVKIRVLTKKVQFLIFDLTNDLLVWDMISRIKMIHFYLMTWLKTLLKINWLADEFSVNWSKVNCTLKSQILTFWSKSSVQDHNSSKYVKIWNLFIKKSKKSRLHFEKSKFLKLRNFSKCGEFHIFFTTLSQFSTMMQDDLKETSNIKVVDLNEI